MDASIGDWIVVFDLDGVIADISHRLKYIESNPKDYDAFHAAAGDDILISPMKMFIDLLKGNGFKIYVVTCRPKKLLPITKKWLEENQVPFDELFLLREDGDNTPAAKLKADWLKSLGDVRENILMAVDDDSRNVEAFELNGLPSVLFSKDFGINPPEGYI